MTKFQHDTLLFISNASPWTGSRAQSALEALQTAAVFDQPVALLLCGDGLYQLLNKQQGEVIGLKTLSRQFGALALYGINEIYLEREALEQHKLQLTDLQASLSDSFDDEQNQGEAKAHSDLNLIALNPAEITRLIKASKVVMSF